MEDAKINPDDFVSFDLDHAIAMLEEQDVVLKEKIEEIYKRENEAIQQIRSAQFYIKEAIKALERNTDRVHEPKFQEYYGYLIGIITEKLVNCRKDLSLKDMTLKAELDAVEDKIVETAE